MRNRILVSIVGIPAILLVLLVLPPLYTPLAVAALAALASFELDRAMAIGHGRIRIYSMLLALAVPFWVYFGADSRLALCGLLIYVLLVFAEALASRYTIQMEQVGGLFFCTLFVSYFLSSVVRIGQVPLRQAYILLPILIPFLSDAMAMFSGMLFGKHKLAPTISPKKTVEGCLGGLLGGTLGVLLYGLILSTFFGLSVQYGYLAVYGLFGSAVSQFGDLSFSYLKRQHQIKDFGSVFPGHGGVLDRFDSVIFCAPFLELLILLLPAIQAG